MNIPSVSNEETEDFLIVVYNHVGYDEIDDEHHYRYMSILYKGQVYIDWEINFDIMKSEDLNKLYQLNLPNNDYEDNEIMINPFVVIKGEKSREHPWFVQKIRVTKV